MKANKILFIQLLFFFVFNSVISSQTELSFGRKKITISGEEICSYTVKNNGHTVKEYLKVENGILLYSTVELEGTLPVKIEITECEVLFLDKSSCAVAFSDQSGLYNSGEFYILYLYTSKDATNIITTVYDDPSSMAIVHKSSVARLKFSDENLAHNFLQKFVQ